MNIQEIKVFVGAGVGDATMVRVLNEKQGELLKSVAHALLEEHRDDGADILSVTVEIVDIYQPYFSVDIAFQTSWRIYKGCEDMNILEVAHEQETAAYTAEGYLVFTVPAPRRPANPC